MLHGATRKTEALMARLDAVLREAVSEGLIGDYRVGTDPERITAHRVWWGGFIQIKQVGDNAVPFPARGDAP